MQTIDPISKKLNDIKSVQTLNERKLPVTKSKPVYVQTNLSEYFAAKSSEMFADEFFKSYHLMSYLFLLSSSIITNLDRYIKTFPR